MVFSALHIVSQVEHRRKHNVVYSKNKAVKHNADYQHCLMVHFYTLFCTVRKHFKPGTCKPQAGAHLASRSSFCL